MPEENLIKNILHYPCNSCGGQVRYSAEYHKITCDYCGYKEDFSTENEKVIEIALEDALHAAPKEVIERADKKVMHCNSCGAKFSVDATKIKIDCGFCGSRKVNIEAFEHNQIQPSGIIPFKVSKKKASAKFSQWIRKGWFHPGKLKRLAEVDSLHGIYIPFWTYDAQTESSWSGDAGFHYYETQTVRVNGKTQTQQVQKTRWERRSGHLSYFFDDILVVGSGSLKQSHLEKILPYFLKDVVNYDPKLTLGWEGEIYEIELNEGAQVADRIMNGKLHNLCSQELGGDVQRNLRVNSTKSNRTFKHIILPVWICAYRYNGKVYQFTINGQTGRVAGKKPISAIRVAFAIFLVILFFVIIFLFAEFG